MNNHRNIYSGLRMALVTAVVCVMGSACVEARDSSIDDEAISEATQADVTLYPPGTKFSCTISGAGPTGRAWGTLTVATDRKTCYRTPDTTRLDVPPPSALHCHQFGFSIGCTNILDI